MHAKEARAIVVAAEAMSDKLYRPADTETQYVERRTGEVQAVRVLPLEAPYYLTPDGVGEIRRRWFRRVISPVTEEYLREQPEPLLHVMLDRINMWRQLVV